MAAPRKKSSPSKSRKKSSSTSKPKSGGKICAAGKAWAKRTFDTYPSAYANMYASGVCSGKITPGGKKGSRKKAMGGGMMRSMYGKGGGVCIRGMNKDAYGKNS